MNRKLIIFLLCLILYLTLAIGFGYFYMPATKRVAYSVSLDGNDSPLVPMAHFDSFAQLPPQPKGAVKSQTQTTKPQISFVITGVGLDRENTAALLQKAPNSISLSFHPDSVKLTEQITAARKNGFDIWLDLPIQDEKQTDAGSHALSNDDRAFYNMKMLDNLWALPVKAMGWVSMYPPSDSLQAFFKNSDYLLASTQPCPICINGQALDIDIGADELKKILDSMLESSTQKQIYFIAFQKSVVATVIQFITQHPEFNFVPLSKQVKGLK